MSSSSSNSVYIHGTGVLSPIGASLKELSESLTTGQSGFAATPASLQERLRAPIAALSETSELALTSAALDPTLDRTVHCAMIAADAAARTGNLAVHHGKALGVFMGSSRGATHTTEERIQQFLSHRQLPPTTSPATTLGAIASNTAHYLAKQHELSCTAALSHSVTCSTSLYAIATAVAWIRANMIDFAIAGGSECCLTPYTVAQMQALKIYSELDTDPYPCRPQSLAPTRRSTFALGEGAAAFLLSPEPSPYRLAGIGIAIEEIPSLTGISKSGDALSQSMQRALVQSGRSSVDVVIPHSPGTTQGDDAEWQALIRVFGERAVPPLVSPKWLIGHTFGASGALSIATALALLDGAKACTPQRWFPSRLQGAPESVSSVLVNATGFGGNAVSIIVERV